MSTDVSASASNEALLRKVIEAQMSGGYDRFQLILDGCHVRDDGLVVDPNENPIAHILAILLDAKGCKASFAHPTIEVTRLDSQGNETTYRRLVHRTGERIAVRKSLHID